MWPVHVVPVGAAWSGPRQDEHMGDVDAVGYRDVSDADGGAAGRTWWDANAAEYLDEHGAFLGDAGFRWGPEGLTEAEAGLLGDVAGRRVLEVGAGAAQCSRWLVSRGADVVATDVSHGMLRGGAQLDRATGFSVPAVQADARRLPFADESFDVVFTSFGAIPFVPDAVRVHAEAARVLRPGGRWVFSVTHPLRWAFPDDPTRHGLTAHRSYFDRRPYVEEAGGRVVYAEYHRTVGDHVRDVVAAGLTLLDVVEPEWPAWNDQVWGGWGPERGAYLPGTAVFVTRKP
jgi:SAM-dependent methyltransferase